MKILALDLGKFNTMWCFFDTKTRKAEFLTAATDRQRKFTDMVLTGYLRDAVVSANGSWTRWLSAALAISLSTSTGPIRVKGTNRHHKSGRQTHLGSKQTEYARYFSPIDSQVLPARIEQKPCICMDKTQKGLPIEFHTAIKQFNSQAIGIDGHKYQRLKSFEHQ